MGNGHKEEILLKMWDEQRNEIREGDTIDVDMDPEQDSPPLRITYQLLTELKNRSAYAFAIANERLLTGQISLETFMEAFKPNDGGNAEGGGGNGERAGPRNEAEKAFFDLIPSAAAPPASASASISAQPSPQRPNTLKPHLSTSNVNPIIPSLPLPPLPEFAKYLILAAYCASYNSPRSDLRMFGRGPLGSGRGGGGGGEERAGAGYEGGKGIKKAGAGLRKVKLGRVGKVSCKVVELLG